MKRSGRYLPGLSGNRQGRPRGARNRKKVLEEALLERHRVVQDGAPSLRSTCELILMTVRNLAMRGDLRAIGAFNQLLDSCDPDTSAESHGIIVLPEMDQESWEELTRQQQAWLQGCAQRLEAGAPDPTERFVPNWALFKKQD
jgi:hypothetical protein